MEKAVNVADKFAAEGYELLTKYTNNKTKVNVICPNGNEWSVRPDRFFSKTKSRCTCDVCKSARKKGGKTIRTPEEFARLLDEKGFKALEDVKRLRDCALMECKECGHTKRKNVQSVLHRDSGCANCNGTERLTTEVFALYMKEHAPTYTLLSEVKGSFVKCKFRCDSGHEYEATPAGFIHRGRRCPKCFFERISGEGHWHYNADLTIEERETMRAFPGYTAWQIAVKKRDNFSCQCCGDKRGGNLVSHHLDGWNIAREKRLDVDNGVTLCEDCHKDFHGKYGYGGNTNEQYTEWLASAENSRRFLYAENEREVG
jgi:hypothetical protein